MAMGIIGQGASALNSGIDAVTDYIKENGLAIAMLLAIVLYLRSTVRNNSTVMGSGHMLSESSAASRNATSREEELRQVRMRQQELANERAAEAAKVRKEKEEKERERKNNVARKQFKVHGEGDSLNPSSTSRRSASSSTNGYNPMQPWTSHSSGYRPARRTVNRGG